MYTTQMEKILGEKLGEKGGLYNRKDRYMASVMVISGGAALPWTLRLPFFPASTIFGDGLPLNGTA